jgi:hypothetical protein
MGKAKAKRPKVKHVPMRTCVGTGERFAKRDLVRVIRTPEGKVLVDDTGKRGGSRGVYVSKSVSALQLALKHKKLEAEFGQALDPGDVRELLAYFERLTAAPPGAASAADNQTV